MHSFHFRWGASLGALMIACAGGAAHAQTAGEVEDFDELFAGIEEIKVTAQRREESVQDVPIAITVADEEFLRRNDIRTIQDLGGAAPGLVTTNTVGYGAAPITIRGIGGANGGGNFFNDEPVAIYIDDVYVGRLTSTVLDLVDIESIQILRGPQGTLYGRNSTAGALLITTQRPTDELSAYVTGSYTSLNEWRANAAVSGRITDTLAGRIAIGYQDREGFINNLVTGDEIGGSEDLTLRGSLTWTPTDRLDATLILEYQDRETEFATLAVGNVAPGLPSNPFIRRDDFYQLLDDNDFNLNDPSTTENEAFNVTLQTNYDLGWGRIESITAYRDSEINGRQDSDSTQFTLFNNNGGIDGQQFSQELRLASQYDIPFNYVAGVFFFRESIDQPFVINNFQGLFGLGTNAVFDAEQTTNAFAAFIDGTYDVTNWFSITAGVRVSYEEKDFSNDQIVTTIAEGFFPPAMATLPAGSVFVDPPLFEDSADFTDISPRIVAEVRPRDNLLIYGSFSQGFKSGGFNGFGLTPAFDEEEINAFEAGVKSEFFNRTLRTNVAGFFYDYKDLQLRLPVPTGGVNIQNVGDSEIYGVEGEVTYQPTENWRFFASAAWLDTEITEGTLPSIPDDLLFLIGAPIPLIEEDVSGNELTRSPEYSAFLSAEYTDTINDCYRWTLSATARLQGSVFFLETNQDRGTFRNSDWQEYAIRFTFADIEDRWAVSVFGENVTNERYITQVTALGGFPNASVNEPAKVGVEATFRY